jgi:hypothetical protein
VVGTQPTLALPHARRRTPNASAFARGWACGCKAKAHNPRHPERTLLYLTIAEHFETWHALASAGQLDGQGDHHTPSILRPCGTDRSYALAEPALSSTDCEFPLL